MPESEEFEVRVQSAYDRWASEMATDLDALAFVRATHPGTPPTRRLWRPARAEHPMRWFGLVKLPVWIAAATAMFMIAVVAVYVLRPPVNVAGPGLTASPTPTVLPSPRAAAPSTLAPSLAPTSLPVGSASVRGFPGSRENAPGTYSWRSGSWGWMHNPGAVEITFSTVDGEGPRAGALQQVWVMDIGDTRVAVVVKSFPTTTAADLAEAEAIVDSIRGQPTESGGVVLTFSLPAGWDSG